MACVGKAVASSEVDCSPLCVRAYCVWSEGVQQRSTKLEHVKARAVANYVENTRAGGVFVLWVGVCFGYGSALKSNLVTKTMTARSLSDKQGTLY